AGWFRVARQGGGVCRPGRTRTGARGGGRRPLRRPADRDKRSPAACRATGQRRVVTERLTVLVAARDEEDRIGATVATLRNAFPGAEVIVADDGSRDLTAARAEEAGARVVRLARRGKGQALTLAELEAAPGALLLCAADLAGDLSPLTASFADVAIAAFPARNGGGFGLARGIARRLIRALGGVDVREPLSGQRHLSPQA